MTNSINWIELIFDTVSLSNFAIIVINLTSDLNDIGNKTIVNVFFFAIVYFQSAFDSLITKYQSKILLVFKSKFKFCFCAKIRKENIIFQPYSIQDWIIKVL